MSQEPAVTSIDHGKTPAQLCGERATRMAVAGELKQPDRIPLLLVYMTFLAQTEGITRQEMYEDVDKLADATERALRKYEPDAFLAIPQTSAPSKILGDRMTKWPGHGLGRDGSFQYVEGEYMKAEDYDAFLSDPGDWVVRSYWPRVFPALQGLAMLPHLGTGAFGYYGIDSFLMSIAQPPVLAALEAFTKAAQAEAYWIGKVIEYYGRMASLGYPPAPYATAGLVEAPFDFMGDTLRGTQGLFHDIRKIPEKVLAAEEKVLQFQVDNVIARSKVLGGKSVFIPLHKGSDGFISLAQFERFYWPQLKSMMLQFVEAGITPMCFYEGCWDKRLQYLAELPKGKTIGWFQQSDIFKVKEVVGDTMCIVGGMPVSKLVVSEPSEISEYTHKLCQEVGKGGGFIMSTDIGDMEGCNPDLVKVWVDATKKYGGY